MLRREKISGDVVAFDGKTHRRTGDAKSKALHMLNAWSVENRLVLGQLAVEEKSNEITAIPLLMDMLDLKGCVVTADALHCQKSIAAKAQEKGADYILALKGNHPVLYGEVRDTWMLFWIRTCRALKAWRRSMGVATRRC